MTASDRKLIATTATEISRLNGKLDELSNVKRALQEIPMAYARGEISLAIAAISAREADSTARDQIARVLRSGVKALHRETLQLVAPIVAEVRAAKISTLEGQVAELEKAELAAAALAGIALESFKPSEALNRMAFFLKGARQTLSSPNPVV